MHDRRRKHLHDAAHQRLLQDITSKPLSDPAQSTQALICLSCESRGEVDELVAKAVAAGGAASRAAQDYGFMYGHRLRRPRRAHVGADVHGPERPGRALRPAVSTAATHRAIEAVWRIESAKVIAHVARIVRDVGVAEELAQDALVAALEHWPDAGVPDNPGAWLMATAKNRALDRWRQAGRCMRRSARNSATISTRSKRIWCPISSMRSTPRARTTSATTCCGSCSPRVPHGAVDRRARRADVAPARRP